MPDKTKATLPGSQSINSKRIGIQITTMIGLVNLDAGNPASGTGIPVSVMHTTLSGEALRVSDADAQVNQPSVIMVVNNKAQYCALFDNFSIFSMAQFCVVGNRLSLSESVAVGGQRMTQLNIEGADFIQLSESLLNFSLQASLTQALKLPAPAALFISAKRSSSNRIFFLVLPERSKAALLLLSCIGTYRYIRIIRNGTYRNLIPQPLNAAKPEGATNTNGPLTKPLTEITIMAELQHTQTRPLVTYNTKFFTWRFFAVPVSHPEARPIVLYTNAHTEAEARQSLPGWLLFFAARLPLFTPEIKGVNHA